MPAQVDKYQSQLQLAEEHFRDRLLGLLPGAATNGSDVFVNTAFNPSSLPRQALRSDADDLLHDAQECIRLRERMDLPVAGSVGQLFMDACQESADHQNAHRRGPRRLAESLLAKLI